MALLQINRLSKQYGSKTLFEEADAHLDPGYRVALIGPNGSGKTTLLRMLLGQEEADSGQITRHPALRIGHLAQEVGATATEAGAAGRDVLHEVMRTDGFREKLLRERAELEARLNHDPGDRSALDRLGHLLEELEKRDEYRLESKAKAMLQGFGFSATDFARPLAEFSGGWLMRVQLARILLADPDLLILDEPTNHLDLESLLWLEEFLQGFRGALLVVSHDRVFLNRVATHVWEVENRKINVYRGDIDAFVAQKEERMAVLRAQYANQQARIAELERFVERFRAKATKARQAQSRLKMLERMDRIELADDATHIRFRFPEAPRGGAEVLTFEDVSLRYPGTETPLFSRFDWILPRGSRLAIVGVNGAGKTSLLKMINGDLKPTGGRIRLGHDVRVGYFAQHQIESLNLSKTVLDELWDVAPHLPMARIRTLAGAFLFTGDAVEKKCKVLSGGEKARVALAKLLLTPANFLVLDEPTNHLDIDSRDVLLEALADFPGTLCLVSHDRAFMSELVTSVLEIAPQGAALPSRITPLITTYDDYVSRKEKEAQAALRTADPRPPQPGSPVAVTGGARQKPTISNNQRTAWVRERDGLEAEITRLEMRLAELNLLLADPTTYESPDQGKTLVEEHKTRTSAIHEALARWEHLCEKLG